MRPSQKQTHGIKDMGKVMAVLKARLAGKADMGKVSNLVKQQAFGIKRRAWSC